MTQLEEMAINDFIKNMVKDPNRVFIVKDDKHVAVIRIEDILKHWEELKKTLKRMKDA